MTRFAKTLLSLILLVILICLGLFYYIKSSRVDEHTSIVNPVITSPVNGCYISKLSRDIYVLNINTDENGAVSGVLAYNNYDKDSSSGTFNGNLSEDIILGNYTFNSEGMTSDRQVVFKKIGDNLVQGFGQVKIVEGKESFEDLSKVTYDPKSTFIKSENCTVSFTDANNTFSFDHNAFFKAKETEVLPTTDWRINTVDKGVLLARVSVPRSYMPQTNFVDAKFTVGRSTEEKVIKSCTNTKDVINQENKGGIVTRAVISGYPFIKFNTSDAGAGSYYSTTSYRGIVDGDCYAIEYTIHSTNIDNYPPDQEIKKFDATKIQNELEKIVESFKFIINSD